MRCKATSPCVKSALAKLFLDLHTVLAPREWRGAHIGCRSVWWVRSPLALQFGPCAKVYGVHKDPPVPPSYQVNALCRQSP